MDMLVFISKAPERSLHYESSSQIAGVIDVFGQLIACVSKFGRGSHHTVRLGRRAGFFSDLEC